MASHTPSTPVPGPVRSLGPALRNPSVSQVAPSCRKGARYVSPGPHSCCPSRCPQSTVAEPRARRTAFSLAVLAPGPRSAAAPGPRRRRAAILPAAEANTVVAPESPPQCPQPHRQQALLLLVLNSLQPATLSPSSWPMLACGPPSRLRPLHPLSTPRQWF